MLSLSPLFCPHITDGNRWGLSERSQQIRSTGASSCNKV